MVSCTVAVPPAAMPPGPTRVAEGPDAVRGPTGRIRLAAKGVALLDDFTCYPKFSAAGAGTATTQRLSSGTGGSTWPPSTSLTRRETPSPTGPSSDVAIT